MRSIRALYVFTGSVFLCALAGCGGSQAPVTKAAATNPVPVISSLSPTTASAGAAAQTLTISGSGFIASSTATFNGKPATVAFTSSSEIAIPLTAADQATGGVFPVVVTNPAPGGGSSGAAKFTVDNPVPAITALSPTVFAVGSPATQLTVTGSDFVPASEVTVAGGAVPTQFVSATQLIATVPPAEMASAASLNVSVANPAPDGGTAANVPVTVVTVASLAVMVVPANSGAITGPWDVFVAADDGNGNPIAGLPVSLSTDLGTLAADAGSTGSDGTFGTSLMPPTAGGSAQTAAVSISSGAQTATAVVSFSNDPTAGSSAAAVAMRMDGRARMLQQSPGTAAQATFYTSPMSVGFAGAPGAPNPFGAGQAESCYSDAALTTTATSTCTAQESAQGVTVTTASLSSEACQAKALVGDAIAAAECIGFVAIPLVCAAATPDTLGAAAFICADSLTGIEFNLGLGCGHLMVELLANAVIKNKIEAASVSLAACTNPACALEGAAGVVCAALASGTPPTQPPCTGTVGLTHQICPAGQSCIFVADYAADQIYAFDLRGNPIAIPPGAFPNLDGPDGLAYDASDGDLYVANTGNGTITAYDQYGNEVCPPGGFPGTGTGDDLEDVAFDAYSHQLYVNDVTSGQILAYDDAGNPVALRSGAFLGVSDPYGIFWDPTTNEVYISDDATNAVTTFDPGGSPLTLSGNFGGLTDPDDFAVDPLTGEMFVTEAATTFGFCTTSGIAAFDENGNPITLPAGAFSTATCPDDIALWGSGNTAELYVSNLFGSSVTVYNVTGTDVGATVAPGGFPGLSEPTGIVIVTAPAATSASASPQSGSAPPARSAPADAGGGRGGAR